MDRFIVKTEYCGDDTYKAWIEHEDYGDMFTWLWCYARTEKEAIEELKTKMTRLCNGILNAF